jgi:hypothetical protein
VQTPNEGARAVHKDFLSVLVAISFVVSFTLFGALAVEKMGQNSLHFLSFAHAVRAHASALTT